MIIFGWNNEEYRTSQPKDIKCFNCGQVGNMFVRRFVKTWHIFFIPMFPIGFSSEVDCQSCNCSLGFGEMGTELKKEYQKFKPSKFPQFWRFSGLLVILGIFIWNWSSAQSKKGEIKSRLENLKGGRIIELKIEDNVYSTLKVCQADEEFAYVVENLYQVSRQSDIKNIQIPKNYSNDTLIMEKSILSKWIDEGKVKDIYWSSYDEMKK